MLSSGLASGTIMTMNASHLQGQKLSIDNKDSFAMLMSYIMLD